MSIIWVLLWVVFTLFAVKIGLSYYDHIHDVAIMTGFSLLVGIPMGMSPLAQWASTFASSPTPGVQFVDSVCYFLTIALFSALYRWWTIYRKFP